MSALGLLGAGFGVAGALGKALSPWLDLYSQHQANKTNRDINQLNNQFNAEEAQKARDYNTMMWNENNRYNDPSAQVERLRKAGINPAFALGQVASGMVSSQPNSGSPASANGNAQMSALQFGSAFAQQQELVNQKLLAQADIRFRDAQTEGQVIDNETKRAENLARINSLINDAKNKGEEYEYNRIKNKYADQQFSSDYRRTQSEIASIDAQTRLTVADAVIRELQGARLPDYQKLELAEIASRIAENVSIQGLNKERAKTEVENRLESVARQHGIRLDNDVKSRTADAIVAKAWIENISNGLSTATGVSGNIMNWYKTYKKFTK